MAYNIHSKKLTVLLVLYIFCQIRNLQATAEDEVSSTTKDASIFDNRKVHGSNRRLAKSEAEPEIIITKGLYNDDFVGVETLQIRYSVSNTTWTEIECTIEKQPVSYSYYFSWPPQWSVIRTWNRCPPVVSITNFRDGESYRFTVQGVPASESGNVTVTSRWRIDHIPPRTTLRANCAQQCTKNRKTFTFFGSDKNGIASYQCKVNNKSWVPCTSPYTVRARRRNNTVHTFQVAAVDTAGNVDPSPSSVSWYLSNGSFVPRVWSSGEYRKTTPENEQSKLGLAVSIIVFGILPCISCLSPCIIGYCWYRRPR